MIMLKLCLRLYIKQSREQDLKYYLLNKCLPISLAQLKEGNNSENLLNEIRQIIYSLYQSKEIAKKLSNNIIKSI